MGTKQVDPAITPASAPASPDPCSYAYHDELRADAVRFLDETTPVGILPDGEDGLLLANCKRCGSTIARPLPPAAPAPVRSRVAAALNGQADAMMAAARAMMPSLGLCPTCGDDLVNGVCEAHERQRRGEQCCAYARRTNCWCTGAWTCLYHGPTHGPNHD